MPLNRYRGEMDDFLAETLKCMNEMGEDELSRLSTEFQRGLRNNLVVIGEHAFRKQFRGPNAAEASSMLPCGTSCPLVSHSSQKTSVKPRAKDLRDAFHALMDNDLFIASITYGTNDTRRVNHRFDVASTMFQEVFGAPTA